MKNISISQVENLNPWLSKMSPDGKDEVMQEIARQKRAYVAMMADNMPARTARRIIERSQHRVNYIIADELVKCKA